MAFPVGFVILFLQFNFPLHLPKKLPVRGFFEIRNGNQILHSMDDVPGILPGAPGSLSVSSPQKTHVEKTGLPAVEDGEDPIPAHSVVVRLQVAPPGLSTKERQEIQRMKPVDVRVIGIIKQSV